MDFIEEKNLQPKKYLTVHSPKENIEIPDETMAMQFPYKLDSFQLIGIKAIQDSEDVLITAHTGSGKTVLALYGIAHSLKKDRKVVYTSPTKSLSNQKYAEFSEQFGRENVGIMTGDIKMNPEAPCMIMTTEILRNMLMKHAEENDFSKNETNNDNQFQQKYSSSAFQQFYPTMKIEDIEAIILDEVHYINDPDRGRVWEEVIVLAPKEATLIMLSATLDKPEIFCSWIGNMREKNIHLIPTSHRVVPLRHYFWKGTDYKGDDGKTKTKYSLIEIVSEKNVFMNYEQLRSKYKIYDIQKMMNQFIDYIINHNYAPALFFKLSRKKCEQLCKMVHKKLVNHDELTQIETTFDHYMREYKPVYGKLAQFQDVYNQLCKGVVYHHSGLIPILKEIIEIIYAKGLIKILFATETFSIGVNMPTKTVVFTELEKFDNKGQRFLRSDEYKQMAGRAGRRGLDTFGTVIVLPTMEIPSEHNLKDIMNGKSPSFQSRFHITYSFVLKSFQTSDLESTHFLSKTFRNDANKKSIISNSLIKATLLEKINSFEFSTKEQKDLEEYTKILNKMNDSVFQMNRKQLSKLDSEKNKFETNSSFKPILEKYNKQKVFKDQLESIESQDWMAENEMKTSMNYMTQILQKFGYLSPENHLTQKGLIASTIQECNELLLTELLESKEIRSLTMPELITIFASLMNERDATTEEKMISDLKLPKYMLNILYNLQEFGDKYIDAENAHKFQTILDFDIYLDFLEPIYHWSSGKSIQEVYQFTNMYDGNFVKAVLRVNNICESVKGVFQMIGDYEMLKVLENSQEMLIRDITCINSLYI